MNMDKTITMKAARLPHLHVVIPFGFRPSLTQICCRMIPSWCAKGALGRSVFYANVS